MMTADEVLTAHRKRDREWAQTEIGKLFYAYENAHATAWQTDTAAGYADSVFAEKRADAAWKKEQEARAAFLLALRGFE